MDFVSRLPRSRKGHNAIWVIVDRMKESAHSLPIWMNYSLDQLAQLYVDEIVRLHDGPTSIVSNRDQGLLLIFGVVCKRPWVLDLILAQLSTLRQMDSLKGLFKL